MSKFPFFPIQPYPDRNEFGLYTSPQFPTTTANVYVIERSKLLQFDGVLNSLYEREAYPFVGDKELSLAVEVTGEAKISLMHRTADGISREYKSVKTGILGESGKQKVEIQFHLNASEQNFGRWYFEIQTFRRDVLFHSACWQITNPLLCEVKPAFIICTFKREAQVLYNVNKILENIPNLYPDFEIYVVDNAQTLSRPIEWPVSVKIIKQRNVGGAGGFGRGIYEATKGQSTHLILMDDDADIDPISLIRMLNLFKISNDKSLFVGGIQLDVYDRTKVADAGAYWLPDRFEAVVGRTAPVDLTGSEAKDSLSKRHQSNFNGWWLFGGAAEGFRKFGMPLPCFVHLDDVEYCLRIQLLGGRVITVPSIAVWHEPWYSKVEGWFSYYNIRNELIRLIGQSPLVKELTAKKFGGHIKQLWNAKSLSRQLRLRFMDFARTYQYGSAALLVKAIEDFNRGPSIITDADSEALHASVMKIYAEHNINFKLLSELPAGFIAEPPRLRKLPYRIFQKLSRNGQIFNLDFLPPHNAITLFPNRQAIAWMWVRAGRAWAYLDPASSKYHVYSSKPESYRRLWAAFCSAERIFIRNFSRNRTLWEKVYPNVISREFWDSLVKTFDPKPN